MALGALLGGPRLSMVANCWVLFWLYIHYDAEGKEISQPSLTNGILRMMSN